MRSGRILCFGRCLLRTALVFGIAVQAEDAEPELTPAEMFEGGAETYENWIEFSTGALLTRGNRAQAEQRHRFADGVFGGLQDFHYQRELDDETMFAIDGRAMFDLNDYRLSLELVREETGFIRFMHREYRTWSNADGGFYRPGDVYYPFPGRGLELDRGEISFEAGLTLEGIPKITFRYTRLYREGEKGSTIWGLTHPVRTEVTRGIAPSFYRIDEERDILALDATHQFDQTEIGIGLRYETGTLNNARYVTQFPGEPVARHLTDREGTSYDMFSVHGFTETWVKENLLFSSGFLFNKLESDISGSRVYGDDFDVGHAPNALNDLGYIDLDGAARKNEYVLNLNLMFMPIEHLTLVPSIRVLREDWEADSSGIGTRGIRSEFFSSRSNRDLLDVRERLDLRYSGVTNWVFSLRGEWTQGEGKLNERGGLSQIQGTGVPPVLRRTEDERSFQKYTAGARWYAHPRVTLDFGGYYKRNEYDYDHQIDSTPNDGFNRYPAYLSMQNFETLDGNVRLTLRPLSSVSLVTRYEYQVSTIDTQPDPSSGLARLETSEMTSHILAQNIGWSPWSRLYLQAGLNYVVSETKTPASELTQAVLDAQNNYWTLTLASRFVLDDKTDLNLSYFYYESDSYKDNSFAGLPLGAESTEHGVTASIVRRLTENLRLKVKYGYFRYDDVTFGRNRNYEAHALFSTIQYRF
jgi:hypothetical protein